MSASMTLLLQLWANANHTIAVLLQVPAFLSLVDLNDWLYALLALAHGNTNQLVVG